jgi:catechol 2,3-dioxygenase-like lactoylglutathione lyase family enzyme
MASPKRVDNMDILCRKVGPMADFYHDVLGFPFFLPYEDDQDWAAIELGNLTLYLFETSVGEHQPKRTPVNTENPPGLDSFAFEVEDLDTAIAELDGKVEWAANEPIRWDHPNGTWYQYRPFYDPEGTMLYVTEPHKLG